jgi:hypothetical protein
MPMDNLAAGSLVGHFDGDWPSFLEAQQRAWDLAVVGDRPDGSMGASLKLIGCDVEGVIRRGWLGVRG